MAKYLLDQPGININELNDKGDNILLSMLKEGCQSVIDKDFVLEIEELVNIFEFRHFFHKINIFFFMLGLDREKRS